MLEDVVNRLPSFGGIYRFLSQGSIVMWYWGLHDFLEDSGIYSIQEHGHCLGATRGIACHSYELFKVGYIFVDKVSLHL